MWELIVSVPDHCLYFYFFNLSLKTTFVYVKVLFNNKFRFKKNISISFVLVLRRGNSS